MAQKRTGNAKDQNFVNAFVTASLTVCIGAMAVIGSIQDGMYGDHSILISKALMDFIIILVMSASMGKGCAFSAVPVLLLQGGMTLLARVLQPFMTDAAMASSLAKESASPIFFPLCWLRWRLRRCRCDGAGCFPQPPRHLSYLSRFAAAVNSLLRRDSASFL